MDAEALVVDWLNARGVGATAYPDVPARRPAEFVSVLLTGGARTRRVVESPLLTVQCWAADRPSARALADRVAAALGRMTELPEVFHVNLASTFRDTDLESGTPRYQLVVELTLCE